MKASMAWLTLGLALAGSACTGGPQYALAPREVDTGIYVADATGPDALVPVLELDAGAMAATQTGGSQQAISQPVATEHPITQ